MKKQIIDRLAYAARDGELSIDAAIAAAAGAIVKDSYLREAMVKRMFAAILTGKWECEEPPLDKIVSDHNIAMAWLAERKEAGKRIDPDNVEVTCWHTYVTDPYRVWPPPVDEEIWSGPSDVQCFARTPGGDDGWVWFDDLPEATQNELGRKLDADEGEEVGRGFWRFCKKAKPA